MNLKFGQFRLQVILKCCLSVLGIFLMRRAFFVVTHPKRSLRYSTILNFDSVFFHLNLKWWWGYFFFISFFLLLASFFFSLKCVLFFVCCCWSFSFISGMESTKTSSNKIHFYIYRHRRVIEWGTQQATSELTNNQHHQ